MARSHTKKWTASVKAARRHKRRKEQRQQRRYLRHRDVDWLQALKRPIIGRAWEASFNEVEAAIKQYLFDFFELYEPRAARAAKESGIANVVARKSRGTCQVAIISLRVTDNVAVIELRSAYRGRAYQDGRTIATNDINRLDDPKWADGVDALLWNAVAFINGHGDARAGRFGPRGPIGEIIDWWQDSPKLNCQLIAANRLGLEIFSKCTGWRLARLDVCDGRFCFTPPDSASLQYPYKTLFIPFADIATSATRIGRLCDEVEATLGRIQTEGRGDE